MIELNTPLGDEVLNLKAGDRVFLSGTIYTARDEAHKKIIEEGFPFEPKGAVIYHCGPVVSDGKIIAAGPTTSARMNSLTKPMLDAGVRGLIGKGGMSDEVVSELEGRAVYFAFTGGCAALAASCMELKACHFDELGMAEAVWEIVLKRLPVIVAIDAHGKNLFKR
ncbi:MAG: FumA C-terminus/TtdB family hydratase beta subunit [Methanocorpusculum sp.]|nr:FumA C-terminus/TtdB family hydratase beta subunit [Methanocorpusculum sp.]